jgi:hypothetical protein
MSMFTTTMVTGIPMLPWGPEISLMKGYWDCFRKPGSGRGPLSVAAKRMFCSQFVCFITSAGHGKKIYSDPGNYLT